MKVYEAADIRRAVGFGDLVEPVARAFADHSRGLGEAAISVLAPAGENGDVHVKSAWLPGRPVFIVKVASWFAARSPAGSGFVAVLDGERGDLLAVLRDEHHLSDVRTAAAGALATRLLARPHARTLAVLGTGLQARLQVLAAVAERPLEAVVIWGRREGAAHALRAALAERIPQVSVTVAARPDLAVHDADVIVTATAAREPVLRGSWLRPGQHVTAVGADDPGKAELDPDCFARADLLVVDSRAEAPLFAGDLIGAVSAGAVTADGCVEIGDLVLGRHPGRQSPAQITVAKFIGLGVQDLAAAELTMTRLEPR
ncbi:ornithine cyclodeaminase family protein [Nonomuraea helvata]|uniref:Ornithine cyclodeaminase family protein n=1 Tax=Nonomuraea helvata TaxID=37484 RepID=A0ABV5SD50_9ACTN